MKQKLVEVAIHDLASDGKAVGLMDGKVIFLKGGLPGERVLVEVTRQKARYNQGIVREILEPSDKRCRAECGHFDQCGGCSWQDLGYQYQLEFKQKQVVECLARIGGLETTRVEPIMAAQEIFYYRNKMEFSFHVSGDDDFTLGLHRLGRFDEIFDVIDCRLESPQANDILSFVREFVRHHQIPVYDVKRHHGLLRFLVIREGKNSGQVMVNVVTSHGTLPHQDQFVTGLTEQFPSVTTIVHNQNGQKSNVATGEIETILYGPGYIEESINGKRFRIRANSFFQTNPKQAERLYRLALDWLAASPDQNLLDLYCGTGTIGILASASVAQVVGLELVPDAVMAARENATLNGCSNVSFTQGDVRKLLREDMERYSEFSIFVLDPPRAGMHPRVLNRVSLLAPATILYISCNPATFARDAGQLVQSGYQLPVVRPVDMFPHTRHTELVALFTRK